MLAEDLEKQIAIVVKDNRMPFFVNATSGTTVLGAFDDLNEIADVCEKYNLWLHVDVGWPVIYSNTFSEIINVLYRPAWVVA